MDVLTEPIKIDTDSRLLRAVQFVVTIRPRCAKGRTELNLSLPLPLTESGPTEHSL